VLPVVPSVTGTARRAAPSARTGPAECFQAVRRDDVLGAVTAIPLIWASDGRLERNRKFVDSPLEQAGFEPPVPRRPCICEQASFTSPDVCWFSRKAERRRGHGMLVMFDVTDP
jgi:hypothetical protein